MTDIEEDLSEMCLKAKNYGAARVSVLPAGEVIVDPRVRFKCFVPACPNFGVNLMCPPRVMDPEEFAKVLSMYTHTILIQYPLCDDPEKMQEYIKVGSIEVLRSGSDYPQMIKKSQVEFMDLICKLERDAVNMGYRFSAGLTGGPCKLCDRCVGQRVGGPCRHPLRARPSMEALGIDVFKTAENAGMPLTAEGDQEAFWTGLLLVE